MIGTSSDFLNIDVLAEAVASKIKIEPPTMQRVFDLEHAAAYCGLTRDAFKKKAIRDRIRKVRFDKCWRYDRADLDAWIESHKERLPGEAA
jgi:Helix-turn-helix domain